MKSVKWIAIIIVTFFAGYFTHATIQGKTSAQKEKIEPTFKYDDENKSDSLIPATEFPQIAKTEPTAKHAGKASSQDNKGKAAIEKYPSPTDDTILIDAPTDGDNQNRKGYGDEKIVAQMPAPFDQLLTKIEGPLREKFKDYADTDSNQKDDWDQRMQSQLSDFILSRPSATDIRIHLINCNFHMCEIRLEEQKRFLLLATFAELLQEPWIINTCTGEFNFFENNGYMLLMRK